MKKGLLTAAAVLTVWGVAAENILVNGDFEQSDEKGRIPGWSFNAKRIPRPQIDTAVKKSGNASVMLGNTTTVNVLTQTIARKDMSVFLNGFAISGWMKYEDVVKGGERAAQLPFLKLEFSAGKKRLRFPGVVVVRTAPGSKDWFKFEVDYSAEDARNMFKDIPQDRWPTGCVLALYCSRQPGKVWLDDVQLSFHKKQELDVALGSSEISGDQLDLKFRADAGKIVEFKILSADGKAVVAAQSKGTGGPQNFSLNLNGVQPGEYTLAASVDGGKSAPVTVKFQRVADAFAE